MNVSLTPELEKLVLEKVKSGMYQTSSEVIREGLRLLKERDTNIDELRAKIRKGLDEVNSGQMLDLVDAKGMSVAERVKVRGRQRLALNKNQITGK